MAQVVTKGLVIREQPYQERDKILTIFTEQTGKIKAIARGVRQTKSTLAAATQLFAYGEFVYYPGKNFANINSASLIESFYPLRSDMVKMALGSMIVELLDQLYDYYQGDARLLQLANYVLYYLSNNMVTDDRIPIVAFALKAATLNGIGPVLDHCVACGQTSELFFFGIESGGTLCCHCDHRLGRVYALLPDQAQVMQTLLKQPLKALRTLHLSEEMIRRIMAIVDDVLNTQIGKPLKSYQFYKGLISEPS